MTYDTWKTTPPDDGDDEPPDPPTPEEERAEAWEYWHQRACRFEAALHSIQSIAKQAEVYHPRLGASEKFAEIAEAARTALA